MTHSSFQSPRIAQTLCSLLLVLSHSACSDDAPGAESDALSGTDAMVDGSDSATDGGSAIDSDPDTVITDATRDTDGAGDAGDADGTDGTVDTDEVDEADGTDQAEVLPDVALPECDAPSDTGFVMRELLAGERPGTANIRRDDSSGTMSLLVAEARAGHITRVTGCDPECAIETIEGDLVRPVRSHVVDLDGDGSRDVLVADIGILPPSTELVGRVVLLAGDEVGGYAPRVLLDDVGRVACAEAANLDSDDDLDVLVCEFGDLEGSLTWLEQGDDGEFTAHQLDARPGTIHAFAEDVDGDDDTDIVAVISQTSEVVMLYRNTPTGFSPETLFSAGDPYYGMSGIELVDLDGDDDIDVLVTNGDTLDRDLPAEIDPWSLHGVAWLENDGHGNFTHRDIARFFGAYSARAADLDGDADLDVVISALQPSFLLADAPRMRLAWFENDGDEAFTRHDIACEPVGMVSIELADVDADGDPDIFGGSIGQGEGPESRLVLWENRLPSAPRTCGEATTALAREIYDGIARACTAVVRLDFETHDPLGYQLLCARYAFTDEADARIIAEADTGFGEGGTRISPEVTEDNWIFYESPGDLGGVGAVSRDTGLSTFGGSIVWDGAGEITYPTAWRDPAELGVACDGIGSVPYFTAYDLRNGSTLEDDAGADAAIAYIDQTAIPEAFFTGGYLFGSVVMLYPRSVGAFDPSTAEWIVLVNGGWLE